ncbi:hypothetical protein EMCRGX_G006385 [Ephydatia muelleri]
MAEDSNSPERTGEGTQKDYQKEVRDVRLLNVSIKGYDKKTGTGFTKEEYYAFRIITITAVGEGEVSEMEAMRAALDDKRTRYEVWRRYTEFELLKHFLGTVYPYIIVPPLPEKAIKGRQQGLEIFLVRLSRHPVLNKSYWFHDFLHNPTWKEAVTQTGFSTKAESFMQSLTLQISKNKADESILQDMKRFSSELEETFKSLVEIRSKMIETLNSIYKVHGNYGRVYSEWAGIENTLATPLQIASGVMDSYSESIENYMDEECLRYFLPLREYIAYCESLRAVVHNHAVLQHTWDKAEQNRNARSEAKEAIEREGQAGGGATPSSKFSMKALSTRLKGGDTSHEGRLAKAVQDLHDAEEAVGVARRELEAFTEKARVDYERFCVQRTADFRSLLVNYVQLQMHVHRKGITTWEKMKQGFEIL